MRSATAETCAVRQRLGVLLGHRPDQQLVVLKLVDDRVHRQFPTGGRGTTVVEKEKDRDDPGVFQFGNVAIPGIEGVCERAPRAGLAAAEILQIGGDVGAAGSPVLQKIQVVRGVVVEESPQDPRARRRSTASDDPPGKPRYRPSDWDAQDQR